MRAGSLTLLIALVACTPEEPEKPDTGPFDQDEDGYDGTEDCDDENAAVFPGALEYCDGIDDDCDGDIDENSAVDMTTWCPDEDRDGYGVPDGCKKACESPGEAWADNSDDCLDTNAFVNPEGHEICDIGTNEDEDCNGLADDDDPGVDATTLTTYYPDVDNDGYGDENADPLRLCDDPSTSTDHYVTRGKDCDDESRRVNPGEDEKADDGIDNNCNGCIDEIPGAEEIPDNGVDDDCNGCVDETPGAAEAPDNGIDDDCDTCVDEPGDDGMLNWYYSRDYDVWWQADWCHEIDACPECDWSFEVSFAYEDDLSAGAADFGLNIDFSWTLGWGEDYPEDLWYYYYPTYTWYQIFDATFDSSTRDVTFTTGYWEGYATVP